MTLASRHKLAEDTPERLVLAQRSIGVFVLAGFFGLITLSLALGTAAAWGAVPWFIGLFGGVLAALSLWATVASLRAGFRPAERIAFDRRARRIDFERARRGASFRIPFELAEFLQLRHERRTSIGTRRQPARDEHVYRLFLVLKGGDEFELEQSGDQAELTALALKIGVLCGLEVSDAVSGPPRTSTLPAPDGVDFEWPDALRSGLPKYVRGEHADGSHIYRWRMLPRHPGLIALFIVLFVFAALPGPLVLVAMLVEGQFDGELVFIVAGLLVLSYKAGPILLMILLGDSRLTLSPEGLDYRVSVMGLPLRSQSGRVAIQELDDMTLGQPAKGGLQVLRMDGSSFYLRLPVGAGALSQADLIRLRGKWLADLGR